MVGDDDRNAIRLRTRHAVMTGDTIIHRHNHLRLISLNAQLNNLRRQTIAIFKAVRDDKIDHSAHSGQGTHHQRRAGSAITVKIANDQNTLTLINGIVQQLYRLIHTMQRFSSQQR